MGSISIKDSVNENNITYDSFASHYETALKYLQSKNMELTLEQKIQTIDNMDYDNIKIDFSGGDALIVNENYDVLKYASKKFGKENITLTLTGLALKRVEPKDLANYVGELNFTYDSSENDEEVRSIGYNSANLIQVTRFSNAGINIRAEMPLSHRHKDLNFVKSVYLDLHSKGVAKLLLMRLFPSGRAIINNNDVLSKENYIKIIDTLKNMENQYSYPKIKLQCALKHLYPLDKEADNPCDAVVSSFGLRWDGEFLGSPWAMKNSGNTLSSSWGLGNLYKEKLSNILRSQKVATFIEKEKQNFGHCKIFSYLHSKETLDTNKIFDNSDPLYKY
ncbi:MAG: hypothetical protein FWE18_00305 [Alphaproteobacteria bacterium]|nr:hypothetical protein [Alphaproteobacteria bacterium]